MLSGAMEIESLQMFFLRRKGIYIYIYINIYLTRLMTAPHTHVYRWKTLNGARFSHGAHRTHPLDIETLVFPPLKIFFYLLIAGVCLGQYFIREYSGLRERGDLLSLRAPPSSL